MLLQIRCFRQRTDVCRLKGGDTVSQMNMIRRMTAAAAGAVLTGTFCLPFPAAAASADDLYTLGQYQVASGIRQIIMFKGSFDRAYPRADAARAKELLRGILRHEFRHHLEFLGGIHNSDSLEAEDRRRKQAYLSGQ